MHNQETEDREFSLVGVNTTILKPCASQQKQNHQSQESLQEQQRLCHKTLRYSKFLASAQAPAPAPYSVGEEAVDEILVPLKNGSTKNLKSNKEKGIDSRAMTVESSFEVPENDCFSAVNDVIAVTNTDKRADADAKLPPSDATCTTADTQITARTNFSSSAKSFPGSPELMPKKSTLNFTPKGSQLSNVSKQSLNDLLQCNLAQEGNAFRAHERDNRADPTLQNIDHVYTKKTQTIPTNQDIHIISQQNCVSLTPTQSDPIHSSSTTNSHHSTLPLSSLPLTIEDHPRDTTKSIAINTTSHAPSKEKKGEGDDNATNTVSITDSSDAAIATNTIALGRSFQSKEQRKQQQQFHQKDGEKQKQPHNQQHLVWQRNADNYEQQQLPIFQEKNSVLQNLVDSARRGMLTMINLSQRGLFSTEALLIKDVILQNPHLSILKLGYNHIGDDGATAIAMAVYGNGSQHHNSLSIIDLGFNSIGDTGCTALAGYAVSQNLILRTLYLSGNTIAQRGAVALAAAILNGCGMTSLHLTANKIGPNGAKALTKAVAESDARLKYLNEGGDPSKLRLPSSNSTASAIGIILTDASPSPSKLRSVEELYLGQTAIESSGCLSISNMTLTNSSLRILSLTDICIEDKDLALFSQSISRNKNVPLEVLQLSFNRITCVGVESLMNAVWGSQTLREIRLDNNRIRDRGAQLAAVVLTSVKLELLDLGFNRITTLGIRSLMKSLAENNSLISLTLSGNRVDTNASKAVSYALAYNTSLRYFYIDNCNMEYASQRHITAGIVSNSCVALRIVTGFRLGVIAVTLKLPSALESWSNEKTLKFIRLMWEQRKQEEKKLDLDKKTAMKHENPQLDTAENCVSESSEVGLGCSTIEKPKVRSGPADPASVVSAAKNAFDTLDEAEVELLASEVSEIEKLLASPLSADHASIMERTESGTILAIPLDKGISCTEIAKEELRREQPHDDTQKSIIHLSASVDLASIHSENQRKNIAWLQKYVKTMNEMKYLPFSGADLRWIHEHFYSTIQSDDCEVEKVSNKKLKHLGLKNKMMGEQLGEKLQSKMIIGSNASDISKVLNRREGDKDTEERKCKASDKDQTRDKVEDGCFSTGFVRNISFRHLNDAIAASAPTLCETNKWGTPKHNISSVEIVGQPTSKRLRSNKQRIDFYPRIRKKVDSLLLRSALSEALVLLRQLKFVENIISGGRSFTEFQSKQNSRHPTTVDIETILLDML